MAKINFSFDTNDKTLSVDIDGTPIKTVEDISLYKQCSDYDEPNKWELSMGVQTVKKDGMRIRTFVSAKTK